MSFIFGVVMLFATDVMAKGSKEVYVNSNKMQSVFLKLGRSTVLRFREKPKKIVLGNSNYFNIEFVENDLTIQPLQSGVTTNLFVYGTYHLYAFNLKSTFGNYYDDLLKVRWKSPRIYKKKKRKVKNSKVKKVSKTLEIPGKLKIELKSVLQNKRLGMTILDFEVVSLQKSNLKTKDIEVILTRKKKSLVDQKFVFETDEIKQGKGARLRVLLSPITRIAFTVTAKYEGKDTKLIISNEDLK